MTESANQENVVISLALIDFPRDPFSIIGFFFLNVPNSSSTLLYSGIYCKPTARHMAALWLPSMA